MQTIINNLPTYLLALALVVVAGFNVWDRRKGAKHQILDDKQKAVGASVEVITIYEKQIVQLKEEKKEMTEDFNKRNATTTVLINELTGRIGKLEGINAEKDKTIENYKEIFQGRNPQMEQILTKLSDLMQRVDSRLEKIESNQGKPMVATTETIITKQD